MNKVIYATGNKVEPEEILSSVRKIVPLTNPSKKSRNHRYMPFDGVERVRISNNTTVLFAHKGATCVCCGLKADRALIMKDQGSPQEHWNIMFYGEKEGQLIEITIDHIKPLSRGGKNSFKNMQTMCADCNCKKGNTYANNKDVRKNKLNTISV